MRKHDQERAKRWLVFRVMILAALAIAAGRIAIVSSREGDTAFQSANDRSRWSTVAALVEDGTYEIDRLHAIQNPIHRHRYPWRTIDRVMHTGDDGQLHHYSSKPPLLPTMVAGVYAIVRNVTGMNMTDQPIYVPRIVLMLVNLPTLFLFFVTTVGVIDRICRNRWGKYLACACVCFGTMVLPFATSLNNHLPAVAATSLTMWIYFMSADRLSDPFHADRKFGWGWWLLAGVSAAFAAANELPALSMMCLWVVLFAWLSRKSILPMAAGIAIVAAAFFGTNWIGHASLRPPYAHRGNGKALLQMNEIPEKFSPIKLSEKDRSWFGNQLQNAGIMDSDAEFEISRSVEPNRWRLITENDHYAIVQFSGDDWRVSRWDDWYEYPGSYWQDGDRVGIDQGERSRLRYLFHMLIGHHGIFSLTPIFLLFPIGMVVLLRLGADDARRFTVAVAIATLVCAAFYLMRPEIDRNYGGVSICFRWLLWFTPLWLVLVAVTIDQAEHHRWFRRVLYALLAFSIFSVFASLDSAWQHPWLYRYWQFLGWLAT